MTAVSTPPGELQQSVQDGAQSTVAAVGPLLGHLITVLVAVLGALVVVALAYVVLRIVLSSRPVLLEQARRCRIPAATALSLLSARITLGFTASEDEWFGPVSFILLIGIVAAFAWLAMRVVQVVEERLLDTYQLDGIDDRRDRKIQTQTVLLRRVLDAVIITIAVAVVLLAIPQVRAVGAGLLASAGVLSVVAGLAIQSTLTNVFAGIQLAFTDAIRVGDVVDVEGTFGTIEDITLSYVVVKIWDGRRMIYPSSHFTSTPFENWTRVGSALSGVVELDVDWRVPMDPMRARLRALVESTELWDGTEGSMQVTDAVGGMVRVRAVVSARNSGDLWDLQCLVREDFINWLRGEHPEAIFAQRHVESVAIAVPASAAAADVVDDGAPVGGDDAGSRAGGRHAGYGAGDDGGVRTGGGAAEAAARTGADAPVRGHTDGPIDGQTDQEEPVAPGAGSDARGVHPVVGPSSGPVTVPGTGPTPLTRSSEYSSMFTGSITAVERNKEFAGPGESAYQERKEKASQSTGEVPAQLTDNAEDHPRPRRE